MFAVCVLFFIFFILALTRVPAEAAYEELRFLVYVLSRGKFQESAHAFIIPYVPSVRLRGPSLWPVLASRLSCVCRSHRPLCLPGLAYFHRRRRWRLSPTAAWR